MLVYTSRYYILKKHTKWILKNTKLYEACIEELYENNEAYRNTISNRGFNYLFVNDIIFYQRPLKSKKSEISDCSFEKRTYILNGEKKSETKTSLAPTVLTMAEDELDVIAKAVEGVYEL